MAGSRKHAATERGQWDDAVFIGVGAGVGAAFGVVFGGGAGIAIGTALGAGAGAAVMAWRGRHGGGETGR